MLTKNEEAILAVALANEKVAAEIASRIIEEVPLITGDFAAEFEGQVAGMTEDVLIVAVQPGEAGNVTLEADSVKTINELVQDWNTANPENQLFIASGDNSQVPEEDIQLSGGVDSVNNALPIANAIKDNKKTRDMIAEYLTICLPLEDHGLQYANKINAIVDAIKAYAADDGDALAAAQSKIKPLSEAAKESFVICIANRSVANSITNKIEKAGNEALDL